MTEQQEHLANLLQQKTTLQGELEQLQNAAGSKRELYWKVQGAIEYLAQVGVTLPEPEETETAETEVVVPEEG
tara:strand:- start:349 stop:567 length:219 start_codon:yes stop_codon:yes gene_type:complete